MAATERRRNVGSAAPRTAGTMTSIHILFIDLPPSTADYRPAVLVDVGIRAALTETVEDIVIVLRRRREVAALADVLLHDFFIEFHAETGGVRHRDVPVIHDGLGRSGDQVPPPRD